MFKKLKVLALAALVLAFACGGALADIAFVTGNYVGSNKVGIIGAPDAESSSVGVLGSRTTLGTDLFISSFSDGKYVFLAERSYTANDSIYVYDASDFSSDPFNSTFEGVSNTYDIAEYGDYLYISSYYGTIYRLDKNTMALDGKTYAYPSTAANSVPVSLAVIGNEIFALYYFSNGDYYSGFTYEDSALVRLDPDLNYIDEVAVGKNAFEVHAYGGSLYVVSFGGDQGDATDYSLSKIEKVTVGTDSMTTAALFDGSAFGGQFAALTMDNAGRMFFSVHTYNADYTTTANFHYLPATLDVADAKKVFSGTAWTSYLVYDSVTDYFWGSAASGTDGEKQLLAFSPADGSEISGASFGSTDLDGPAAGIAPIMKINKSDNDRPYGGSGSSGCSTGGLLIAGLAFAAIRLLYRGKNA